MKMENLKSNFVYQIMYQILAVIVPLVTAPYISRILGAEGIGVYSYTYSVASYFVLFAKLGIDNYGNRTIAAARGEKLNETFSSLFVLHIIITMVVSGIYIVYLYMGNHKYKSILLIQFIYILAEMFDVNWLFWGLEKFKLVSIRNSVIKLVTVVLIFIFVREKSDINTYCFIMACSIFLSEIVLFFMLPQYVKFIKTSLLSSLGHLSGLCVFFIPAIAVSIYKVMDKIMLGMMAGATQVGYYENSEKITTITLSVITALGTVMLPRMTSMAVKGEKEKSLALINKSMKIILILVVAFSAGLIGISTTLPYVFFGKEFQQCNILIIGLAFSMPFIAFANVLRMQYLIPNHYDKCYMISIITGAVINVLINWLLIPKYYAMGAVFGTIVAEVTVCVIQASFCKKQLPIIQYIKEGIPYVIIGCVMAVSVRFIGVKLGNTLTTLVMQVSLGAVLYIGMTVIYMCLKKDEVIFH